jgi:hypothetical protein
MLRRTMQPPFSPQVPYGATQPSAAWGPPPPKRGMSPGCIVGIVVAVILVPIVVLFAVGFVQGFRNAAARSRVASAARATASTATPANLDRRYATKNGLLVAHYPSDFAAKNLDDATLVLGRNLGHGEDEAVLLAAVPDPISDDVNEFARVLIRAMTKKIEDSGDSFTETGRRTRACFRDYPGLEVEGFFDAQKKTTMKVKACFFMNGNRGYELKYIVPADQETSDVPLLQNIMDATELVTL